MAALTKTQLEYAKTRIAAAKAAYIHRHMAALGEEPDVTEYTEEQKEALIRDHKAVLKPPGKRPYSRDVSDFFDYVDTQAMATQRALLATWTAGKKAIEAHAEATEKKLLDELIMAPDGAAALARIADALAS